MKTIAVPLIDGRFSSHFGGAEAFALYTVDGTTGAVGDRRVVKPPQHGRGIFPVWLHQQGATVVLASGMGPRATGILAEHGIEVVLGIQGGDPDALVHQFLAGTLEATGEPCHEHGFHDCRHHDGRDAGPGGCGHHEHDEEPTSR